MNSWLKRHRYYAWILIVALAGTWFFFTPLYREVHILEFDRVRQEVEQIGGERDSKQQQLNLLRDTTDGDIALQIHQSIQQLNNQILEENKKITSGHVTSLLVIVSGVAIQLLLAWGATYVVYRYLFQQYTVDNLLRERTNQIENLNKKIHGGWPATKEAIGRVLVSAPPEKWPQAKEWKKYLDEWSQERQQRVPEAERQEPTDWWRLSTVLFNVATVVQDSKPDIVRDLKYLYDLVRKIVLLDTFARASQRILPTLVFLGTYLAIASLMRWAPISSNLAMQMQTDWPLSMGYLFGGLSASFFFAYLLQLITRYFTDKSSTDLDDVIVGIVAVPILATSIALSALFAFDHTPTYFRFALAEFWRIVTTDGILVITTAIFTYFAVAMFNRVVIVALERWSARTKQSYDDLFVQILKVFGSFFIVAAAGAILLVNFQTEIRKVTGIDNILLPYTIVVSVVTAVIGYSTQEGVQNFFGGLLLQVEKPFDLGDRVLLETGEICDVRSRGIRAATFYNVLENTEISIPNRVLANQRVTNLSRPNLELRVAITILIPLDRDGHSLQKAEDVLLDIAYAQEEVDRAWATGGERRVAPSSERQPLSKHLEALRDTYPIEDARVERLGGVKSESIPVFDEQQGIFRKLQQITQSRESYGQNKTTGRGRYEAIQGIAKAFGEVGEFVYAIGKFNTDARISNEYLNLVDELNKEPSVHSQYKITEEGRVYCEVTFRVYAIHLERRFEVAHRLNKDIQRRFKEEGIEMLSIGKD